MTEQAQSSADIASRALQQAKASLPPEEFRLFVHLFNTHYIHSQMSAHGMEAPLILLFLDGLARPLIYDFAEQKGISVERGDELNKEALAVVIEAVKAAIVPQEPEQAAPVYPGVYGLIIDRARAEGFDVPTLEQMAAAEKNAPSGFRVRWDWIQSEERFFFQQSMRRVVNGKPVSRSAMEKDPR